jgi:hypothetical protein
LLKYLGLTLIYIHEAISPLREREEDMNSIVTTYPAGLLQAESGLWNFIRNALKRLLPLSQAVPMARDPVREAAEVRLMADAIRLADPRFAADLYAAADRHERLYAAAEGGEQ